MSKPKRTIRTAEELKALIDKEREEMDRLDAHGSAPIAEGNCARRISALQRELKESHGIDY
jgi:hypothetical protein